MPSILLGFILLAAALGLILLTALLVRIVPRLQPAAQAAPTPPVSVNIPSHHEAVLLVQSGRVVYLNEAARELFNLWEEEPNLERMARRARPDTAFLSLCAAEGQARFSLNGRYVEGTSYGFAAANGFAGTTPANHGKSQFAGSSHSASMLVSLRRPQWSLSGTVSPAEAASGKTSVPEQAFGILTELSQAIASSLDLEDTLLAIMEGVERVIPFDISEITVWDAENRCLIPYRLNNNGNGAGRLEMAEERYHPEQGYSGKLIADRKPLRIHDVEGYREVRPAADRYRPSGNGASGYRPPFLSFLGVPLQVAGELVGTLELASFTKNNFSPNDQEILQILAVQSAVAVHNALLYRAEQQRALELSGLANLAQALSAVRDPQDLFARLLESIAPLLRVQVLGFLVYDESSKFLEAQIPFTGIQDTVVVDCRTSIEPESEAEKLLQSAEPLISEDAFEDPRLIALNLHILTQSASLHHCVLAPLNSGGRMLGYLMAANKEGGGAFDQNDLRLLAIITGQAAPIIDNATLVQQARRRAQRAETLRRISSLTGSAATVEEALKFSIVDLVRLVQADVAAVFLRDETRGELRLHQASLFGVPEALASQLKRIPIDDPQFALTVTGSRQQMMSGDLSDMERVPLAYRPLVEEFKIRSAIDVPLIVHERAIGEVILGSYKLDYFSRDDLQALAIAAGQLAAAVDQASLYNQTGQTLGQQPAAHGRALTALTRISRELNTTLDLEHLVRRVFEEVVHATRASCGSIVLFDLESRNGRTAISAAGALAPRLLLAVGDRTDAAAGEAFSPLPLERTVLEAGDGVIVEDFENAVSFAQSEFARRREPEEIQNLCRPAHPGIRSALIVPVIYQGQTSGLIHLHSSTPGRFDAVARETVEALAIQASIALGNARRYQDQVQRSELLNRQVETLTRLFEASRDIQLDQPVSESLESIAYAIQAATPFDVVLVSVYDPESQNLQRTTGAGLPLEALAKLQAQPQPWQDVQVQLQPARRQGSVYFASANGREKTLAGPAGGLPSAPAPEGLPVNGGQAAATQVMTGDEDWRATDFLLVPLRDSEGQPLGLIRLEAPRDGQRPDRTTVEALEIFAAQANLVIESRQRLLKLKERLATIESELEHARGAAQKAQFHLPTLLHKDLDQTLFIQQLGQRSRRISAGLDIAGIVNRQSSRSEVLQALGREVLHRMDFEIALLAEPTSWGPRLISSLGSSLSGVNIEALLGQRNPLRQSLQTGELLLVSNVDDVPEWQSAPLLSALEVKAFVCLPIVLGDDQLDAVLLAASRTHLAPFDEEDRELFRLLTRQAAIALQNLTLLDEARRRLREVNLLLEFSRQLGSLDTGSVLHTLVESASHVVPAAQTAMVALWEPRRGVLTPRAAAGYADLERLMEITYEPGEALPGQVFQSGDPVRLDEVEFAVHYNLSADDLARFRDATGGRLPVSSLAVPIVGATQTEPLGVLVVDNSKTVGAFTAEDQALLASLAQQTALTLENARLYQASEQRAQQLQALTAVATTITSSLETEELIASLLDQLKDILPYDTGTLWLRQGRQMIVRAARGFDDSEQRAGIVVEIADSALLKEMIDGGPAADHRPISVMNVNEDPRFPSFLEHERLSWLGVPLIASGEVTGVIALEKTEPGYYTSEHVQIATTFAGQAAVALENAKLYQESVQRAAELDQRSQFLAMLNRLSRELSGSLDVHHILTFAIQQIFHVIPSSTVSAVVFDPDGRALLEAEYPDNGLEPGTPLPDTPLFDRLHLTQGVFNTEDARREPELAGLEEYLEQTQTRSLLVLSLAAGGDLHGLLLAARSATHSEPRFEPDEVELARTISNQVAIAVQNARLFAETRSFSEVLERRVDERTAELAREHKRTETLLRIITELSSSLDLEQVLNRTLQVLNEMIDAEQITVLIARPGEKHLFRLASVGYSEPPGMGGSTTPFTTRQGLAGWVIANRQAALIENVLEDPRWMQLPDQPLTEHRSALAVPLMIGAEALGTLLLFHRRPAHFSTDQLDLVQAAANQVAVAVNNAELYRLIRDQAEDLGAMLRNQQIETSRSKAILESVADGVLVTDANQQITLFNAAAEAILGLKRQQVLGKPLETFTGLFGRSAQAWRETITNWSQDPASRSFFSGDPTGDTFAERIKLENGRIVAVRLAPVIMRNDFLGTVSIFQDITHQVEVDRLKSEFVATVSHELRTPMTSIKGYVEILLMGAAGPLNEQQARFLDVVKTNAERLAVLVNDLLDISRIESGKVTLSFQPLDLEELVDEALTTILHRSQEENKPVTVQKEVAPNLGRVYGDLERVRQILENLLDNAFLYNTPDGQIMVRVRQLENEVQVDVKDTGMGITPEEQARVFERFFRGESPLLLGVSGTGLGLSIVENLVRMHQGRIWLESAGIPGEGSTFSFTLPNYDPTLETGAEGHLESPG